MDWILELYLQYKNWIDFVKDVVFFAGSYAFFYGVYKTITFLGNKQFADKSTAIEKHLHFRERLEPVLNDFIFETAKNTKDIAIRFVHWKNYPLDLQKDGFKHYPFIRYFDDGSVHYGWIDNTGVNIQEHIWYLGNSIYIDEQGIFFFDKSGTEHQGFQEFADAVLVFHLPFENIVNFDFKQFIEYEPVFYTRYYYTDRKRLYDDAIVVRERDGRGYLNIDLSQKNMMRRYSWLRYQWFKLKALVRQGIRITRHKKTD